MRMVLCVWQLVYLALALALPAVGVAAVYLLLRWREGLTFPLTPVHFAHASLNESATTISRKLATGSYSSVEMVQAFMDQVWGGGAASVIRPMCGVASVVELHAPGERGLRPPPPPPPPAPCHPPRPRLSHPQIERVNPHINAVCHKRFEAALKEARAADEALKSRDGRVWLRAVGLAEPPGGGPLPLPPFLGVPCTVKECFAVEGLPQSSGARTYACEARLHPLLLPLCLLFI
jgi:hypothetical protein